MLTPLPLEKIGDYSTVCAEGNVSGLIETVGIPIDHMILQRIAANPRCTESVYTPTYI